jgi:hypothetical protein
MKWCATQRQELVAHSCAHSDDRMVNHGEPSLTVGLVPRFAFSVMSRAKVELGDR